MSVVMESEKGDRLYCIAEFHATPAGMPFDWAASHHFQIGESVVFRDHRVNDSTPDHPSRYVVMFDANDGQSYAAVESFFVVADAWNRLAEHFANRVAEPGTSSPVRLSPASNVDTPLTRKIA